MLRHLVGLLAGIALAPVLWIAVAWAADVFPRITEGDVTVPTVLSVVVLSLVGIGGAYLVAGHLSPLFAASSGALLVALSLWPATAPESVESALGWLDRDGFLYPAGAGLSVALPLGALLLCSAMAPTRWRALRDSPVAASGRVVASASRDRIRREDEDDGPAGTASPVGRGDRGDSGNRGDAVTDTIADDFPDTPPVPLPPPRGSMSSDPDKTTTPFRRRGETGAVWTPLDEDPEEYSAYGDDRR